VDKTLGDALADLVNRPEVEPHGPAPANEDPDTPVHKV
jgi:catalase